VKTRELGKSGLFVSALELGCICMEPAMKLSRFATPGIYFMAHAGKRPSLDQFITSTSASFFDHRLNPRS